MKALTDRADWADKLRGMYARAVAQPRPALSTVPSHVAASSSVDDVILQLHGATDQCSQ